MRTRTPVSEETYERIGKAYAICSQYPDVFGDVTFRKFCGMFVDDIIDEDESCEECTESSERIVRMREHAETMYCMLRNMLYEFRHDGASDREYISQIIREIGTELREIDGKESAEDE